MFYSGKGDDGQSELFGSGERCNKNGPIFEALGTVDELNSLLGICYSKAKKEPVRENISLPDIVRELQEDLFIIQAELAGTEKNIINGQVEKLEEVIAALSDHVPKPKGFVMAGSNELSAHFDFARSVARRAERAALGVDAEVSDSTKAYLNRLSSLLYVLARYVATGVDEKEQNPSYGKK